MDFATHYYPNVLEAMRTRWISPQFVATNRLDEAPRLRRAEGARAGRSSQALEHRDLGDAHGVVRRAEGALRSPRSAAARPASGRWDLYAAANDIDIYREWAMAIVHGQTVAVNRRAGTRRRHDRPPTRPRRCTSRATRASTPSRSGTASGSSTPTSRRRARPPSRSRPGTWRTRGCGMRHPDYDALRGHARRRRPHGPGPRPMSRNVPIVRRLAAAASSRRTSLEDRRRIDQALLPSSTPDTCTFAYHGPVDLGAPASTSASGLPSDLASPGWRTASSWSSLLAIPDGSRLEYKLEVADSFGSRARRGSPERHRRPTTRSAPTRCAWPPATCRPTWAVPDPAVAAEGTLKDFALTSAALGRPAHTTLSTSRPGSTPRRPSPHPLLVVHDGGDYLHYAQLKTVLDNLIHRGACAPTVVAAFSHPGERLAEYADDPRHARFLTAELVPALEAELPLVAQPTAPVLPHGRQLRRRRRHSRPRTASRSTSAASCCSRARSPGRATAAASGASRSGSR